jgi:hypothetical protein
MFALDISTAKFTRISRMASDCSHRVQRTLTAERLVSQSEARIEDDPQRALESTRCDRFHVLAVYAEEEPYD